MTRERPTQAGLDRAAQQARRGWLRQHRYANDTGRTFSGFDEPFQCSEDKPCWYDQYQFECAETDSGAQPYTIIELPEDEDCWQSAPIGLNSSSPSR